ncbi:MAG: efflux RND transporter permease subunit [Deltaproteobacteria bacterium]|nr:efflux RND transporter permease subunit [Deltaproteobacteria bacterium]
MKGEDKTSVESGASGLWERLIGWLIDNKLVVFVFLGILVAGGIYVAPFDWRLGTFERDPVPVDAIPDIGENQQIVFTTWSGRSPRDVEDQVTYPLTTALLGIPGVRTIRSSSAFGFSTIYVIFEDDIEFYWSRSRVLEKLASLPPGTVPRDVTPTLGPDATALGQIFWYTLEGRDSEGNVAPGWDLHELRSIQDWTVRYSLQSVAGVSEVASVGGFVQEYQVDVDPEAMRAHGVTLQQVTKAVRESNLDVGARTIEINRAEYLIRGLGFVKGTRDLEQVVVATRDHTPIRIADVARVNIGPALRRGALDDAGAPAVGGVVVSRFGENPLSVIDAVKKRIAQIAPGLPTRTLEDGTVSQVTIVPFYDRTELIHETLDTLSTALYQQILITIIVVLVMLRNLLSSLLVSAMLPIGVLAAFILMKFTGVDANIMALGGIAIAIGAMVDVSIVFVENIRQHLSRNPSRKERGLVIRRAVAEVAPAVMTSVMTTIVSFLPVFALSSSEAKLFTPLAYTKTFAMAGTLVLVIVILPGLAYSLFRQRHTRPQGPTRSRQSHVLPAFIRMLLSRGRIPLLTGTIVMVSIVLATDWLPLGPERGNIRNVFFVGMIISIILITFLVFERAYPWLLRTFLRHKAVFLVFPVLIIAMGASAFMSFGREYMPPFDEGSYLYMPTTMPHASIGQVQEMLQEIDARIDQIPEVKRVVGKLGRADSPLDPAPVSMIETVVTYIPEYRIDERGTRIRQWRDHIRTAKDIWDEIAKAAEQPGVTGAPMLMPIGARIVMLQSGMRAPLGIKVQGPGLETLEKFGLRLEEILRGVPSIRAETVFADRIVGKPYIEIDIDREAIARHGLSIVQVQEVLQVALGGATLSRTVEGRQRYPIRVRYMREERDSVPAISSIFVSTPGGEQVPLAQLASIVYVRGPQVIKSEDTLPTSYVLFDKKSGRAEVDTVEEARAVIEAKVKTGELEIPAGVSYRFTGSYENQLRSEKRLMILIPVALALVFILLYLQFHRVAISGIIYTGVLVSVSGGFLFMWLYGQPWFLDFVVFDTSMRDLFRVHTINLSVAVWIGFIALVGIVTDDGVIMSTYLKQRFGKRRPKTIEEIRETTLEAGLRRVRPCLMTTATTILALLPIVTSQGKGADTMAPMALPIIGGMIVEVVTLFIVPVLYAAVEERICMRGENPR